MKVMTSTYLQSASQAVVEQPERKILLQDAAVTSQNVCIVDWLECWKTKEKRTKDLYLLYCK